MTAFSTGTLRANSARNFFKQSRTVITLMVYVYVCFIWSYIVLCVHSPVKAKSQIKINKLIKINMMIDAQSHIRT